MINVETSVKIEKYSLWSEANKMEKVQQMICIFVLSLFFIFCFVQETVRFKSNFFCQARSAPQKAFVKKMHIFGPGSLQ